MIFWPNFKFDDGGTADKLFIILSDQRNGEHLALIVTSQEKRGRRQEPGCKASEGWFFIQKGLSSFAKPTWVTLTDPIEFAVEELADGIEAGTIREVRVGIKADLLRAIANCFARSEWVTDHHKWLLEPAKQ